MREFPDEMFATDPRPFKDEGVEVTLGLRSTEILVMGVNEKGKLKVIARQFLDGEYIACNKPKKSKK